MQCVCVCMYICKQSTTKTITLMAMHHRANFLYFVLYREAHQGFDGSQTNIILLVYRKLNSYYKLDIILYLYFIFSQNNPIYCVKNMCSLHLMELKDRLKTDDTYANSIS